MSDSAPPDVPLVKGIVLTHGSMCHGLVDAVQKIAGSPEDALHPVSNEGQSPEALLKEVARVVGEGPALIFTDLQTGSCALTARFVCRDPGNREVIFGVNLPMLLDFVFHRELPLDELVERLLAQGRSAIRSTEPNRVSGGNRTPASG
jgi:N-acetylgalactosamine PTS system EIIA component